MKSLRASQTSKHADESMISSKPPLPGKQITPFELKEEEVKVVPKEEDTKEALEIIP